MKIFLLAAAAVVCAGGSSACAQADHRADRHAARGLSRHQSGAGHEDPQTGELRGASLDLARELAKRIGKPLDFKPIANPPAVIEAVKSRPGRHRLRRL